MMPDVILEDMLDDVLEVKLDFDSANDWIITCASAAPAPLTVVVQGYPVPPQPWRWGRPALGRLPKWPARDRRSSAACVTPSVTPLFAAMAVNALSP